MAPVRVAQLDRASGYGPEGRGFESCHAHFVNKTVVSFDAAVFCTYILCKSNRSLQISSNSYKKAGIIHPAFL